MALYHISTRHSNKMSFETIIDGHSIFLDAKKENGGEDKGPSPKKLLLSTLAGCTGMDVVSLLHKMRVEFSDFEIITDADLTEDHPKVFTHIDLIYRIRVKVEDHDKVEKAIKLSEEKYCGISAMLKKNSPINVKIEYLD